MGYYGKNLATKKCHGVVLLRKDFHLRPASSGLRRTGFSSLFKNVVQSCGPAVLKIDTFKFSIYKEL